MATTACAAWVYHNTVMLRRPDAADLARAAGDLGAERDDRPAGDEQRLSGAAGVTVIDVAPGGEGVQFADNCYWSGGREVSIDWGGRPFPTFESWRRTPGRRGDRVVRRIPGSISGATAHCDFDSRGIAVGGHGDPHPH